MVTFAADTERPNNIRPSILQMADVSGDLASSDILQSAEFRGLYGSTNAYPTIEKNFSYKVVDRLSKWEGGKANPYQNPQHNGEEDKVETVEPETITFLEFLRQFCHPSYDLTEVSVEDIDRTKLMHDRFLSSSQFDFNYTTLLIIASVIAAMGLGSNSVASIIASMLVSPLMGPVTAIAYGISIGDYKMVRIGLVTEVVSLIICIVIGLICAGAMLPFKVASDWPVEQMTSRGTVTNFLVGLPIAFFSGLGVAVGLLDDQTNSLVGVAISASLLPPAVNCGMLWVIEFNQKENDDSEYAKAGIISLGLTIANIVLIIIASMIMFRLKETLPIEKSIFWTDLGIARKIYHNVAILPKIQQAPDDAEIKKRVTTCFPRASAMIFTADFNPMTRSNDSGSVSSHDFSADSSFNRRQKYNANYQWAKSSSRNTTSRDNSGKDDSSKENSGKGFRDITSLDIITENTANR